MKVVKPRSRQVAFRVSDEEYESLRESCISLGARSISELARSAACGMTTLSGRREADPLAGRVQELDLLIRCLNRKVEQMLELVPGKIGRPALVTYGDCDSPLARKVDQLRDDLTALEGQMSLLFGKEKVTS
jgi:hypothetical protein